MMRVFQYSLLILLGVLAFACKPKIETVERSLGFEEFVPRYNSYVDNWLNDELAAVNMSIQELESALEQEVSKTKSEELIEKKRIKDRYDYRKSLGEYFSFKSLDDLPSNLVWEDGMDEPDLGDSRAKKGGVFRNYILQFPATVRQFGPNANSSFRSYIYDEIEIGLVGMHPKTQAIIPGIAREWAIGPDEKTVYFRLHKDARYTNGDPILAKDFMVSVYLRVSDFVTTPYQKQYYREQIANITVYDDHTLSVSLPEPKAFLPLYASLSPSSPRFFKDYGPDFDERYQWKVAPSSGAYFVKDEDIVKGVSVTLTRDKNWWAADKKFYRNLYNPDKIVYTVVRDQSKAFELFRAGELDYFSLTQPEFWYQKSEIPEVFDGYIERYTYYNQYPRVPRGLYLNLAQKPLDDKNIRWGIQHSLNWRKLIDVMFRGDFTRLNQFVTGYGMFEDKTIQAPEFNIRKAREYFAQAGYTEEGSDGILKNAEGAQLSISVSYPEIPIVARMMAILKEEAKKCGFDLVLDGNEPTVNYKRVVSKKHKMCFTGWGVTPPVPSFFQFFHSSNAYDEKGQPKPNTNNLNSYSGEAMDKASLGVRFARNKEELKKFAFDAQKIIYDEALFSPGYQTSYVRFGCWRWMKWSDTEETRLSPPIYYTPIESYVWWIDDDLKKETLKAKREGRDFPEVQKTVDEYRDEQGGADE